MTAETSRFKPNAYQTWAGFLAFLLAATTLATEHPPSTLHVQQGAPVADDFGPQFLDVDRKGRTFLLRAETLEVFEVQADGSLEASGQLKAPAGIANVDPVRGAVIASDSTQWYLRRGEDVWLTDARETEKLAPVGWRVEELSRIRDTPVVSVIPVGVGRPGDRRRVRAGDPAPLLLILSGSDWSRVASEGEIPTVDEFKSNYARINQERMTQLGIGGANSIWVADQYRYRVRELSSAGKVRWQLLGDLEIHEREDEDGQADQALRERAGPVAAGRSTMVNLAIPVILGLTEAPDQRLYLVVQDKAKGLALDRFDPVEVKLHRVPLDLEFRGNFSVAAGRDGLHLAAFRGETGRWFMSWENLEAADWQLVEDVEIGG